jgi:flagellar hook protein FlgE
MGSAFSIALSALTANSAALSVVGDNLANMNTTGFKTSNVEFNDLISQSLGIGGNISQIGEGVGPVNTVQQFTQGSITTTNGATDAAIQGGGFFVVQDPQGSTLYTRAGDFQWDANGNLTTANGDFVQGWLANGGTINPNGPVSNLTIQSGSVLAPKATTTMSMNVNLNSSAAVGSSQATFSAPIQVYDSLGNAHTLTATFNETAAGSWGYTVTIPAADTSGNTTLASGTFTFDQNGNMTAPASPIALSATNLTDGASDMNINWNLMDASGNGLIGQVDENSGMSSPTQNGFSAGQVTQVGIENGGQVVATYSNGQQLTLGQIALASIANPSTMVQVGNGNYQVSSATAQAAVGAPETNGRGQIMGGAVEASTTDMAQQFTELLTYQNSYQAASRVITTADQLMQDTINLIHQ